MIVKIGVASKKFAAYVELHDSELNQSDFITKIRNARGATLSDKVAHMILTLRSQRLKGILINPSLDGTVRLKIFDKWKPELWVTQEFLEALRRREVTVDLGMSEVEGSSYSFPVAFPLSK